MERLVVTADGSCLGNPGPGGWAWVVDQECWAAGGHARTTNNLMELRAVYQFLQAVPPSVPLVIQTDSTYVIQVFTQWIAGWREGNWRTSSKKDVANRDAIELIAELLEGRDVSWRHVKGHAGHLENELADEHARAAAKAVQSGTNVDGGHPERLHERLDALGG